MQFDTITILTWVTTLVGGSVGLYGLTELVKLIPKIPINSGQTVKIRGFVALLSALATLGTNLVANGEIAPVDLQNALVMASQFVLMFLGAHATHKTTKALNGK